MRKQYLPKNQKLRPFAQRLRREATPEENHLWYDFLRTYPIQFKRQFIIGSYIADFYCDQAKLVIELDGEQHYVNDAPEYDAARTAYFESLGITVLRFDNSEIKREFEAVCRTIEAIVHGYE